MGQAKSAILPSNWRRMGRPSGNVGSSQADFVNGLITLWSGLVGCQEGAPLGLPSVSLQGRERRCQSLTHNARSAGAPADRVGKTSREWQLLRSFAFWP